MVVLDGAPGISKHKVLRLAASLLPEARVFTDLDCDSVLLGRGLLECRNPCCYDHFQRQFLERRLKRDLKIKPRAGITLRVRDTRSCGNFAAPYKLAASGTWFPKTKTVYTRNMIPTFDQDCSAQADAERRAAEHAKSARRICVLLRPDSQRTSVEKFLAQHDRLRQKELRSAAESFVRLLDLHQMTHCDQNPNRIVRHDPSNPQLAANAVVEIVKTECAKMKLTL